MSGHSVKFAADIGALRDRLGGGPCEMLSLTLRAVDEDGRWSNKEDWLSLRLPVAEYGRLVSCANAVIVDGWHCPGPPEPIAWKRLEKEGWRVFIDDTAPKQWRLILPGEIVIGLRDLDITASEEEAEEAAVVIANTMRKIEA